MRYKRQSRSFMVTQLVNGRAEFGPRQRALEFCFWPLQCFYLD